MTVNAAALKQSELRDTVAPLKPTVDNAKAAPDAMPYIVLREINLLRMVMRSCCANDKASTELVPMTTAIMAGSPKGSPKKINPKIATWSTSVLTQAVTKVKLPLYCPQH